ncbi:hypothetical protein M9978_18315 [Sphingomonas sp. MG17]|jgi:hypothetical protein|uniref:Uncharacterized protein n=1 Tax=Sphingomonas tagetis TaxID=2949092 RepID=A0A9X2HTK4_9SPHN|nr:hypothetical protein [Sphingomonas tagetis]MCP3732380.1 hypothetical protein [Sphingomonas tagetis]
MSDHDLEYFRQREQDERACAERALDQTARRAHLDLAERYAARLRQKSPAAPMPRPA